MPDTFVAVAIVADVASVSACIALAPSPFSDHLDKDMFQVVI